MPSLLHRPSAEAAGAGRPSVGTASLRGWRRPTLRDVALRYGMVWVLIALTIVTNILYPGFFEIGNLRNLLTQNAPVGIVAIGMTFVIVAGGFDLSVSAVYALAGVLFAIFAGDMSVPIAGALALGCGLVAGAVNGLIITRLAVNPFVATLGSASAISGLAFLFSDSQPVVTDKAGFDVLGNGLIFGVPVAIVVLGVLFLVAGTVLARTVYGRSIYAIGGNAEAARLSGIRVDLIRFSTYALTGICAALAGMFTASLTGVGQADIGANVTLDSIAVVIIGGTSLMGGEGAMWRSLVGLLILATINNLFDALALDTSAQLLAKGLIVIGAVSLDSYARRRHAS